MKGPTKLGEYQVTKIITHEKLPEDFEVLNPKQRAFVLAMFTLAEPTLVDCVRAAGYGTANTHENSIHTQGQKLLGTPAVRNALHCEMLRRAEGGGPKALRYMQEMAFTKGHRDQFKALKTILNFAGMREIAESRQEVVVKTDEEQLAELRAIAMRLGIPAEDFLGEVTDAEYTVIGDGGDDA